jgi:hypothetical protein
MTLSSITQLFSIRNITFLKALFLKNLQESTSSFSKHTKSNYLPTNGSCKVNPTSGTTLLTNFRILCSNWTDQDGFITTYEYMGKIYSILQEINFG